MVASAGSSTAVCESNGLHKRRYDHAGAKSARRRMLARGETDIDAYRCPDCRWWHVGHHSRSRGR